MKFNKLVFLIFFIFLLFSSFVLSFNLCLAENIQKTTADINKDNDIFNIEEEEQVEVKDSFESYNRFMFKFNNKIYTCILNPLSKVYSLFFPKPVQRHIDNMFNNAKMPVRFLNNAFQCKFQSASTEAGRFVINSTIGLAGLFDPAKSYFNLEQHVEDFGQTLGYYNIGSGSYIVWPILGPSNIRDSVGYIVDVVADPLTWAHINHTEPDEVFDGLQAVRFINNYSYNVSEKYKNIIEQALDPYIAIRHAYSQSRYNKIKE